MCSGARFFINFYISNRLCASAHKFKLDEVDHITQSKSPQWTAGGFNLIDKEVFTVVKVAQSYLNECALAHRV